MVPDTSSSYYDVLVMTEHMLSEKKHKNSVKIARPVTRKVDEAEPDHLTSDCPLAAKQIQHVSKNKPDSAHPISLIKKAYGVD